MKYLLTIFLSFSVAYSYAEDVKKTKLCKPRIKSLMINALSATIINIAPKIAES